MNASTGPAFRSGRGSSIRTRMAVGLVLILSATLVADGVAAQSVLMGAGLGAPMEPLDARSRALGGVGIGNSGWHVLGTDPAAAGGLYIPAIAATIQPTTAELADGREAGHTRFPTVSVSYPFRTSVFFAQFGSFLDQEWEARSEGTIQLGGSEVRTEDRLLSSGGIGQVRVGWARRFTQSLSFGATVGTYVGTVERTFQRSLDPAVVGADVEVFSAGGRWRASGTSIGLGTAWDPSSNLRLAAALSWSSDLRLAPQPGGVQDRGRYSLPVELRGGGTVVLTPGLALLFGLSYADWSDAGEDLRHGESRGGTFGMGGGLELTRGAVRGRPLPIRVGVRHQQLPFHFMGEPLSERTYSGGFGVNFEDFDTQPIARLEVGVERGERRAGISAEQFWRTTISLRLAGG